MSDKTSLLAFPCDFPIKIIGDNTSEFVNGVKTIIRQYYPETTDDRISQKDSDKGNYVSITATLHCHDKETLDALYTELTRYPGMKMVL